MQKDLKVIYSQRSQETLRLRVKQSRDLAYHFTSKKLSP
ncbi:hypothetical protein CZ797_12530 [Pseudoalteromonas sp. JB197]|nr:hypothetical protein CZ797_12530 [Pseudoalteromonas sp. JB197]